MSDSHQYTDPDEVQEFVSRTGVDSLAIAIGTSHGAYKFKGKPELRFDILAEVEKRLPDFPIVLHGASSVPQKFVDLIDQYGGNVTACIRQHFAEHPEHFDPRQYLAPARTAIKEMVKHKIINVLGSNDKA